MSLVPKLAQGPAKPANHEDIVRDESGITKPNLHRRIDEDPTQVWTNCLLMTQDDCILETQNNYDLAVDVELDGEHGVYHTLAVNAVNSYRISRQSVHDEDSTTSEIP